MLLARVVLARLAGRPPAHHLVDAYAYRQRRSGCAERLDAHGVLLALRQQARDVGVCRSMFERRAQLLSLLQHRVGRGDVGTVRAHVRHDAQKAPRGAGDALGNRHLGLGVYECI